jgi:DNA-binding beta-propeller fold protein YncE
VSLGRLLATGAAALAATASAGAAGPPLPSFLTAWGSAGKGDGAFQIANGIAVDDRGDVYVADTDNNRIQKFAFDGRFLARLGRNGGDGSAGAGPGELARPFGVAVDGWGNVYVADKVNDRVVKYGADGRLVATWGSTGTGAGQLRDPRGLGIGPNGHLYVADHGNHRIVEFTATGAFVRMWGRNGGDGSAGSAPGEFNQPRGVGFDRAGDVYVAEKLNHRIQKFTADGRFLATWGSFGSGDGQFNLPYGVALDGAGHVFVADTLNHRIQEFDTSGRFLAKWGRNGGDGSAGSAPGEFNGVYGVAVDCRGNVYATDEDNARVQKFGDRARPAPLCRPKLTLQAPTRANRGRSLVVRATCDRACIVRVGGAGVRAASARLDVRGTTRLALRILPGAPRRVTLVARASGLAGTSQALRRAVGLSR